MPGPSKSPNAELRAKSHFSICHTEEQGASSAVSSFRLQLLRSGSLMVLASEEKLPGPSWPWLAETQLALSHRKESTSTSPKGELNGELENVTEKNTAEATTVLHLDSLQN